MSRGATSFRHPARRTAPTRLTTCHTGAGQATGNSQTLLERVEDAEDVAWLKRARRKPLHYRPLEDYLAARSRK